jgi:hypothetical protein
VGRDWESGVVVGRYEEWVWRDIGIGDFNILNVVI